MSTGRRPTARRAQAGVTMLETLLTVAVSALIAVPMLGWAVLGMQQHAQIHERSVDGASLGLLRTSFSLDVADASRAEVGGSPQCASESGSVRLLELIDGTVRVEYLLVDDATSTALARVQCPVHGGRPASTSRLVDDVTSATEATCAPRDGIDCAVVTLQVVTALGDRRVLHAALRVDAVDDVALQPPTAAIDAQPGEGLAPLVVRFDGTDSADPTGGPLRYAWDLGDGTTSDSGELEHRYERAGDYTVTLTVVTERGTTATAETTIRVAEGAPTAVIDRPTPGAATFVGTEVVLSGDGSLLADGRVARPGELIHRWELGDGRTFVGSPAVVSFGSPSPAGGFPIRLTVTDREGRSGTTETTVTVLAPPRPGAPSGLRQTNAGQEQGRRFVELAWDRVEGADRYEVFLRCTTCPETASAEESGTTVRVRGLEPGRRTYLASVRTRNALSGEWSEWSAEIEVRS